MVDKMVATKKNAEINIFIEVQMVTHMRNQDLYYLTVPALTVLNSYMAIEQSIIYLSGTNPKIDAYYTHSKNCHKPPSYITA